MYRHPYHIACALIVLLASVFTARGSAAACTLDGKATALADGRRAVVTGATYSPIGTGEKAWAPFRFATPYRAGVAVTLTEDRAALRRALPAEALARPWRWDFGDGSHAVGWAVAHRYARPGAYRIAVSSYYPSWRRYIEFDSVRIAIGSR